MYSTTVGLKVFPRTRHTAYSPTGTHINISVVLWVLLSNESCKILRYCMQSFALRVKWYRKHNFSHYYVSLRIESAVWTSCFPFIASTVLQQSTGFFQGGRGLTNFLYGVSFINTRALILILSEGCAPLKQTSQSLICTSHVGQCTVLLLLTTGN
jgi:hypothetical protein